MAEWLKAHAWKACLLERVTWVRIPLSPPFRRTTYQGPYGGQFYTVPSKRAFFSWRTMAKSFWGRINKNGPVHPALGTRCWLWLGAVDRKGYGQVEIEGSKQKAHRHAFFLKHGYYPQPCGLHKCDMPSCCNPDHVFEGTTGANNKDRTAKGRSARGSKHGSAKLNTKQAKEIRVRSAKGISQRTLAVAFDVSQAVIRDIVAGRIWKHCV